MGYPNHSQRVSFHLRASAPTRWNVSRIIAIENGDSSNSAPSSWDAWLDGSHGKMRAFINKCHYLRVIPSNVAFEISLFNYDNLIWSTNTPFNQHRPPDLFLGQSPCIYTLAEPMNLNQNKTRLARSSVGAVLRQISCCSAIWHEITPRLRLLGPHVIANGPSYGSSFT